MSEPESSLLLFAGGAFATFLGIVASKIVEALDRKWQRDHDRTQESQRAMAIQADKRSAAYAKLIGAAQAYRTAHVEVLQAAEVIGVNPAAPSRSEFDEARAIRRTKRSELNYAAAEAAVVASASVRKAVLAYQHSTFQLVATDSMEATPVSDLLDAISAERETEDAHPMPIGENRPRK